MRKLFLMLMILSQCFWAAVSLAEENYPEENYHMYYQGYKQYPITFVQWGEGYVLDGYSITKLDASPNILVADIHPVNMDTAKMSSKTLHIRVDYEPHVGFKAYLQEERGAGETISPVRSYTNKKIGGTSVESGMFFNAGKMLWELAYNEPFFKDEPILKPVNQAGCPLFINVGKGLAYSRISPERACIAKNEIFYEIVFAPTYYIVENYHTPNEEPVASLENVKGKMQVYDNDADVALVKEYMGVSKH